MSRTPDTWILTAQCPSVLGTVDAVTRFLFEQRCYVTEHHSFDDRLSSRFFIRVEFRQPDGFDEQAFRAGLDERLAEIAAQEAALKELGERLQELTSLLTSRDPQGGGGHPELRAA